MPAEWDEPISDVLDRVMEHAPPATIVILHGDELKVFEVSPAVPPKDTREEETASPRSTVGMLYQAVERSERSRMTFRVTEWSAMTASRILVDA